MSPPPPHPPHPPRHLRCSFLFFVAVAFWCWAESVHHFELRFRGPASSRWNIIRFGRFGPIYGSFWGGFVSFLVLSVFLLPEIHLLLEVPGIWWLFAVQVFTLIAPGRCFWGRCSMPCHSLFLAAFLFFAFLVIFSCGGDPVALLLWSLLFVGVPGGWFLRWCDWFRLRFSCSLFFAYVFL